MYHQQHMGHICPVCKQYGFGGWADRCSECILKQHSPYCDILAGWCHKECTYKRDPNAPKKAACACPADSYCQQEKRRREEAEAKATDWRLQVFDILGWRNRGLTQ